MFRVFPFNEYKILCQYIHRKVKINKQQTENQSTNTRLTVGEISHFEWYLSGTQIIEFMIMNGVVAVRDG